MAKRRLMRDVEAELEAERTARSKLEAELADAREGLAAATKEVQLLTRELERLEADQGRPSRTPTRRSAAPATVGEQVDNTLTQLGELRDLLAAASADLSSLHSDEIALAARRSRVLSQACTLLARAIGESGYGPPPIPKVEYGETHFSIKPVMDITEVAELIESLRPPEDAGD
jgi:chromosome segregation ATPase